MKLPDEMLVTANVEANEEAWAIADFPAVLNIATRHCLACLGGQFQFRGPIGVVEMYWLDADSTPRRKAEAWTDYVDRANEEVLEGFRRRVAETDFRHEALQWQHIRQAVTAGDVNEPLDHLYFVAYFEEAPLS